MSLSASRLIAVVLLLASLAGAQLFGVVRGFICECTGASVPVASADCRAETCHPGASHDACCQEHEHRHQHQEVRETLDATSGTAPVLLPVPLLHVVAILELPAPVWKETLPPEWRRAVDTGPPPPLIVKETVVLLV